MGGWGRALYSVLKSLKVAVCYILLQNTASELGWLHRVCPAGRRDERPLTGNPLSSSRPTVLWQTTEAWYLKSWAVLWLSVVKMDPRMGQLFQCRRGNFKVYLRDLGPQFPCVWWHETTKHLILYSPVSRLPAVSLVLECWSLCSDCISSLSTLIADFPSLVTLPKALQASLPLSTTDNPQPLREEVGTRSWVYFSKYPLSISSSWPGLRYSCRKLNSIW